MSLRVAYRRVLGLIPQVLSVLISPNMAQRHALHVERTAKKGLFKIPSKSAVWLVSARRVAEIV